jgi:pyruvate decarboxylase
MDALTAEIGRLRLQVHNLKGESGAQNISIGNYLLARLEQLGVRSMFGVPGDFNLDFLDLVEDHPKIDWVGNCNELNAAYAADGYARVKENSIGVVTTTFGVGELSAINGIAGAFSEMVPVLHIVGYPSTIQQKTRPLLHHTLGDGRYDAYQRAATPFVIHEANLLEKETAAAEIDTALTKCITKARPVYVTLPMDLVKEEISSDRLSIPLSSALPPNDPDTELFILDLIQERVAAAGGDVIVLVDACVIRHHCRDEVLDLLKKTGLPVYGTPMGKTAIAEGYERYGGIYIGALSHPTVKEKVENAKLILSIGLLLSDFNTGNFSYAIPTNHHIELHSDYCMVQHARFDGVGMKHLLPKLADRLQQFHGIASKIQVPPLVNEVPKENTQVITHTWFWPRVSQFFKPNDVIVTETGTSNFGIIDVALPDGAMLISQILWGSIGWSVGSSLGAALAAREKGCNRVILFVGEGSLQLSVQELSPTIRKGLTPIVFVINNSGYTIERCIHGLHRHYNDVANWNWTALLHTMDDSDKHKTASYTVRTKDDLENLLVDEAFAKAEYMQLVEVIMDKLDAPRALLGQTKRSKN